MINMDNSAKVIHQLISLSNPKNIEGMRRFAVGGVKTLGINIPVLRKMAKEINCEYCHKSLAQIHTDKLIEKHKLAQELWESGYHEARILTSMIDEPSLVTEKQMDSWIADFDSWDVCDQVCMNLFDKTTFAFDKAIEWANLPLRQSSAGGVPKTGWICAYGSTCLAREK